MTEDEKHWADVALNVMIGGLLGFALVGLVIVGILFTYRVLNTIWPVKPRIETRHAAASPKPALRSFIIKTGGAYRHPSPLKAVLESPTTNTGDASGNITKTGEPSAEPLSADNAKNGDAR